MQALENVEVSVVVALALGSLAALRNNWPAAVAAFFFLISATLNAAVYVDDVYVGNAVVTYFTGALFNLLLMVMLVLSGRQKLEGYGIALCLMLLCFQYTLMALDEYQFRGIETWMWSWSYEFRASIDFAIIGLGIVSILRSKGR